VLSDKLCDRCLALIEEAMANLMAGGDRVATMKMFDFVEKLCPRCEAKVKEVFGL
jgi:hypothetical protein